MPGRTRTPEQKAELKRRVFEMIASSSKPPAMADFVRELNSTVHQVSYALHELVIEGRVATKKVWQEHERTISAIRRGTYTRQSYRVIVYVPVQQKKPSGRRQ